MEYLNLSIPNNSSVLYNESLQLTLPSTNASFNVLSTKQPQQYVYLFSNNSPPILSIDKEGIYNINDLLRYIYYYSPSSFNGTINYINYSNIFNILLTVEYNDAIKFLNNNTNYSNTVFVPIIGTKINIQQYNYLVIKNNYIDYGYSQDLNYQISACVGNIKNPNYIESNQQCDNIMNNSCANISKKLSESNQCDCINYDGSICNNYSCANGDYYLTNNLLNAKNNCKYNLFNCIQNNISLAFNKSKISSNNYCNVTQYITPLDIIIVILAILIIIIIIAIIIIIPIIVLKNKKLKK